LEATISSLGKRRFLLHNVHETEPAVFETRWVMSYLAGPMTREQIRSLTPTDTASANRAKPEPAAAQPSATATPAGSQARPSAPAVTSARPVLPPAIVQRFVPRSPQQTGAVIYAPRLLAAGDVTVTDTK